MIADTVPDVVVRQDWSARFAGPDELLEAAAVKHRGRGRPVTRSLKLSPKDLADRREVAAETLEALSESFWGEARKRAK